MLFVSLDLTWTSHFDLGNLHSIGWCRCSGLVPSDRCLSRLVGCAQQLRLNQLVLFANLIHDRSCHFWRVKVRHNCTGLDWALHCRHFKEFVDNFLLFNARQVPFSQVTVHDLSASPKEGRVDRWVLHGVNHPPVLVPYSRWLKSIGAHLSQFVHYLSIFDCGPINQQVQSIC